MKPQAMWRPGLSTWTPYFHDAYGLQQMGGEGIPATSASVVESHPCAFISMDCAGPASLAGKFNTASMSRVLGEL